MKAADAKMRTDLADLTIKTKAFVLVRAKTGTDSRQEKARQHPGFAYFTGQGLPQDITLDKLGRAVSKNDHYTLGVKARDWTWRKFVAQLKQPTEVDKQKVDQFLEAVRKA